MKLAMIGTGRIVTDALSAVQPVDGISVTAIYARPHSAERGQSLAEKYAIDRVFTDYELLLEQSDIDAVYIGLVNSAHYAYAKRALLAGKHVILEKAFTGYAAEAEELRDIAREKRLMLLEAITVLHSEIFAHMKANLKKLGPIRSFMANYSQYSSRYDNYLKGIVEPAFDRSLMGGSLFDINVYCIHYCVALFGEPESVTYCANIGFNGIDTSGTAILRYSGFTAVCAGAKDSNGLCFVSVQGENGSMISLGQPNTLTHLTVTTSQRPEGESVRNALGATLRRTETEDFDAPIVHHRLTREFGEFASIIDSGDFARADALLDESIAVMHVLEKARVSAGIEWE